MPGPPQFNRKLRDTLYHLNCAAARRACVEQVEGVRSVLEWRTPLAETVANLYSLFEPGRTFDPLGTAGTQSGSRIEKEQ